MRPVTLEGTLSASREEVVQRYLAQHSDILTTVFGLPRLWSEGGPDGAGHEVDCLPKFRLGNEYVTDFVIVVCRSVRLEVILVELEPPTARPFTKTGEFGRRLNGAVKQLNDWFGWLEQSENREYFRKALREAFRLKSEVSGPVSLSEPFTEWYHGKIVIGRRDMMTEADNRRRSVFHKNTGGRIEIVPYDRLLFTERRIKQSGQKSIEAALRRQWKARYTKKNVSGI